MLYCLCAMLTAAAVSALGWWSLWAPTPCSCSTTSYPWWSELLGGSGYLVFFLFYLFLLFLPWEAYVDEHLGFGWKTFILASALLLGRHQGVVCVVTPLWLCVLLHMHLTLWSAYTAHGWYLCVKISSACLVLSFPIHISLLTCQVALPLGLMVKFVCFLCMQGSKYWSRISPTHVDQEVQDEHLV